ncbi:MAG: heavy metal-associated domain-containing protein [Phycisphaerales bacterium]|jgi:hypothetical protein|nr:heavy metal-associated domain-containing protein [Phycisphaerales bacterium]
MRKRTLIAALFGLTLAACEGAEPPKQQTQTGDRIVIPVGGMSCGSCEAAIEGAAMQCEDVNAVEASAPNGEVVLWIKPGHSADPAIARIKSLGFSPSPQPE